MTNDEAEIRVLATQFRAAIIQCPPDVLPLSFESFPRGSCGDATPLLGAFLKDRGFGTFDYALGERGSMTEGTHQTHAWLQRGDLVVDITADQFEDADQAVIVTRTSSWHRGWRVRREHTADFRIYDPATAAHLASAYIAIVSRVSRDDAAYARSSGHT